MRKLLYIVLLALAVTACKTTEANYRAAYEKAKAKQSQGLTQEEIVGFAREEAMPKSVYHGDSIPLKRMYASTVRETDTTTAAARYSVALVSFSQRFNAGSAADRLRGLGYDGARILVDREKKYHVICGSSASLDTAVTLLRAVEARPPFAVNPPYPTIIEKIGNR
ncbi:MAG: SPOR domain-containing protein [Muribaculaceae bacterium]|nr:SPOR domain-containing protein [Muribaculaceae bacterium]